MRKEELLSKTSDYEMLRSDCERMKNIENENRQLRDLKRDHEFKISNLNDQNTDLERNILGMRN